MPRCRRQQLADLSFWKKIKQALLRANLEVSVSSQEVRPTWMSQEVSKRLVSGL